MHKLGEEYFVKRIVSMILTVMIICASLPVGSNIVLADDPNDFMYEINNSTVNISGYIGVGGLVTVPDIIETFPVVSIGSQAFTDNLDLTGIVLPNSVTSIGDDAFSGCLSLESAELGTGITSIGDNAFASCEALKGIVIPESVTTLGIGAFNGCLALSNVTIGGKVTGLGESVFSNCSALTNVVIPDSVINIDSMAFGACTGLKSVKIGEGVQSIGESAFNSCILLVSVELPASITNIGVSAFSGCEKLLAAIFKGNAPSGTKDMFFESSKGFMVYYDSLKTGFTSPLWYGYKTSSSIFVLPTPPVLATSITLNKTTSLILVNKTFQLIATIFPANTTDKNIVWVSDNLKVATVSTSGLVTAKGPGKATITATNSISGKKALFVATVLQPVISVKFSKATLTVMKGKTLKLKITINPVNASNNKVVWKTSNSKTVSVSSTGTIKGIKKGFAYLSVITVDGKKSARCKVTVK